MSDFRKLRDIREDSDLTQAELAEMIGITKEQYGRYERGVNELPLRYFKKICLVLNVSPSWLLDLPEDLKYPK